MKSRFFWVSLLLCFRSAAGENQPNLRMTVTNTMDTSHYGLAEPLKKSLGAMYQSTNVIDVELKDYAFSSITRDDLDRAFEKNKTELISFVHMDDNSLSVFFFSIEQMQGFIVSSQRLDDAPGGKVTNAFIEERFILAVNAVLSDYNAGKFRPLPGIKEKEFTSLDVSQAEKAKEARKLFRELASLEERGWYAGGTIGMTRYTIPFEGPQGSCLSAVNVGLLGGRKLGKRFGLEAGLDLFTHVMAHGDLRFHLPVLQKYVNLSLSGGGGSVLARITENFDGADITSNGGLVYGPGLAFDIPLLSSTIRGEVRVYFGNTTLILATYGIHFSL